MEIEHYQKKNVYLSLFAYVTERVGTFSLKTLLFAAVQCIFMDN